MLFITIGGDKLERKYNHLKVDLLEERAYQFTDAEQIVAAAGRGLNCGLVYPTGTGKTITAFLALDYFLARGKVLFLAHTNALCEQHHTDLRFLFDLPEKEIEILTGKVSAKKRGAIWQAAQVVVATPQTIVAGLDAGIINFENLAFVVFDEMHMANKKYAYVRVAQECRNRDIRTLGLTASSGREERVERFETTYNIGWWIYRSVLRDEQIRRFVFPKADKIEIIPQGEILGKLMPHLRRAIWQMHNKLAQAKLIKEMPLPASWDERLPFLRLTELNDLYSRVNEFINTKRASNEKGWAQYAYIYGAYYRLMHLLNLVVTEDWQLALDYIQKIASELEDLNIGDTLGIPFYRPNAASVIWGNHDFHYFWRELKSAVADGAKHPKRVKFVELARKLVVSGNRLLVFSNYKETLEKLEPELLAAGITCKQVAGRQFMPVREQKRVIQEFKDGAFSVLLATTVVEAGIHVPKIDAVINYSMPLTGIAQIQRGGRAGRTTVGIVYYLIMDNSNDTSLFFSARADNKRMDETLRLRLAKQEMEIGGEKAPIIGRQQSLFGADFAESTKRRKPRPFPKPKSALIQQMDLFA